jgi:protein O-GlcNAc transferase
MVDLATIDGMLSRIEEHWQRGALEVAEALCGQLLQLSPDEPRAWFWMSLFHLQRGALPAAESAARRAVALDPNFAWAWNHLSAAIRDQGRAAEAEPFARRAVMLEPTSVAHWVNLGNVLGGQQRWSDAAGAYRQAVACEPQSAVAWNNLGAAEQKLRRLPAAQEAYERSLALVPDFPGTLVNYAMVLSERGQPQRALEAARKALALEPANASVWIELANALWPLGKPTEAAAAYRRAIELRPSSREDRFYLASVLWPKWFLQEAETVASALVADDPQFADAWALLGVIQQMRGKTAEALAALKRSVAIQPGPEHFSGQLLCEQYADVVTPEHLLRLHRQWHDQYAAHVEPLPPRPLATSDRERPLRLGFVSKDFGSHPVGYCVLSALEALDRSRCEVVCYSDRAADDALTPRFRAAATRWHEVYADDNEALTARIRADEIDVLIDVAGHTGRRLLVFARRPAPVQVAWFGYPGTTGLAAIDYLLADHLHVVEGEEQWYAERILRMPHGYACYAPLDDAPPVSPLPALLSGSVTFGSFNNPAKFSTRTLDLWAAVLQRVPTARLLLKYGGLDQPDSQQRLHGQFAQRGIAAERILLEGWSPHGELMAAYQRVDLALDTLPYSGGVTTCEALWMGVPVITCPGQTFAGRHSISHMTNAGYPQFVAQDALGCVELAALWSSHLAELAALRSHMREQVRHSPLGDAPNFARDFLAVLRQAWESRQASARSR